MKIISSNSGHVHINYSRRLHFKEKCIEVYVKIITKKKHFLIKYYFIRGNVRNSKLLFDEVCQLITTGISTVTVN